MNLLVNSIGIKLLGDGEWQARKQGVQGRRQWSKVHPAIDTATCDIRAVEVTPSGDGDSPPLAEMLGPTVEDKEIDTVTADRACDARRCQTVILNRQATPMMPIRKDGRPWKEDCPSASPETKPCEQCATLEERSASAGRDTEPKVGSS